MPPLLPRDLSLVIDLTFQRWRAELAGSGMVNGFLGPTTQDVYRAGFLNGMQHQVDLETMMENAKPGEVSA